MLFSSPFQNFDFRILNQEQIKDLCLKVPCRVFFRKINAKLSDSFAQNFFDQNTLYLCLVQAHVQNTQICII